MSAYQRWHPADEELLRKLWDWEGRTARECAEVLGVTRNAVIGKVHRLQLARRSSPILAKLSEERRRQRRAENQRRYKAKHPKPPVVRNTKSNLPKISAPRRSSKPIVVSLPVRNTNDSALIAGWLAQNGGARRFERGATGDPAMMALWLRERGYQVTLSIAKGRPCKVIDPKGMKHSLSLSGLTDLVDALRVKAGLEPTLAREAA